MTARLRIQPPRGQHLRRRTVVDLGRAFAWACAAWSSLALASVEATAQAPAAPTPGRPEIVFVDADGQELFAGITSNPKPQVRLQPVRKQDVRLLGSGRARIRLSGEVTDPLADIVPGHAADITAVKVDDQALMVTRVSEPPSVTRPFAFRGRFAGDVTVALDSVPALVLVEAENAVGNTGNDFIDIEYEEEVSLPIEVDTGNLLAEKFLDPFTLVLTPLRADARDSVTFLHGGREAKPADVPLVETEPESLTFRGRTAGMGEATFRLQGPFPHNDPARPDVVRASFDSTGLLIWDQELEFMETGPATGVFRSSARRLPDNRILQVRLDRPFDAVATDRLHVRLASWKALRGVDPKGFQPEATLKKGPSGRFVGTVTGLGKAEIEVVTAKKQSLWEMPGLVLALSSGQLGLNEYNLEVFAFGRQELEYQSFDWHEPEEIVKPGPPAPPPKLIDVEGGGRPAEPPEEFWPFWIVLKGVSVLHPGDHGAVDGRPFDLTTEPLPGRGPELRSRLPFVYVRDTGRLRATNVLPAFEEPAVSGAYGPKDIGITFHRAPH